MFEKERTIFLNIRTIVNKQHCPVRDKRSVEIHVYDRKSPCKGETVFPFKIIFLDMIMIEPGNFMDWYLIFSIPAPVMETDARWSVRFNLT
ncbi:MAG: hypothetical protein U0W24_11980 [Bacteroidales bacterium]